MYAGGLRNAPLGSNPTAEMLKSPPPSDLIATLDRGESEAIQLARETLPDFILMDERLGRRAAAAFGLTVIGALGLLRESFRRGYVAEPISMLDRCIANFSKR